MGVHWNLEAKIVLVTGATKGIGRAVAEAFAREHVRMTVVARDAERLRELETQLRMLGAADVLTVPGDVAVAENLAAAVSATLDRYGAVDVVVSNAGGPPSGTFFECTDAMWDEGFQRNFLALVRLSRSVIPPMQTRRWGRIIHISSVAARQPIPGLTISNALRAGLLGLVRSLATEVARDNITVNCVLTGYTRTEHVEAMAEQRAEQSNRSPADIMHEWVVQIPMGRLAEPAEIAQAVLFLASESASYITGTALPVDGAFLRGIG